MLEVIIPTVVGIVVAGGVILPQTVYSVKQQTNVIIERFGRFQKIAQPGLQWKVPFIDRKVATSDLRIQQLDLNVETKTKDNVFVMIAVSVQYQVNPSKVFDSHYKLSDHRRQMTSYVFDTIRASVPKMTLDEAFARKDDIAQDVATTIGEEMSSFGFNIVKTLIADVNPDEKVKSAMNDINAAQRKRVAAQELAQADKIKVVTDAEARAEAKRLEGVGMSNQRQAIIKGFAESLESLEDKNVNPEQIVQIILFSQYLDTLSTMGEHGSNSIMLPSGPGGMSDLYNQIQTGVLTGNAASHAVNAHTEKKEIAAPLDLNKEM